jgi:serine/threonine protein kinase
VLSRYAHPNLVALLGYCVEKKRMLRKKTAVGSLVLEFMPGGSLLERLCPTHADPPLTAQERFDIAADVARALHYLHAEARTPLVHQDVKTDNILLAEVGGRIFAKVADFGTARIAPQLAMNSLVCSLGSGGDGRTHHSTSVIVGTRPYMAPEYAQMGHVSEKTDTFAFGVVLLELLTGRPPQDEGTGDALHTSAYELLCEPQRRLPGMLDARVPLVSWTSADGEAGELGGRALWMSLIAKRCLESHPHARGTMREALPKVVALAAAGSMDQAS